MKSYSDHPISAMFPLLTQPELKKLSDDIKEHGLKFPIILYEGKILDGRNRYRACKMAEVEPIFKEQKIADPVDFVVSTNLHRRHLSESQRAVIAAKLTQIKGKHHANLRGASTAMNVSQRSVSTAKGLLKDSPEKAEEVAAGKKSLHKAAKEAKKEKNTAPKDKTGYPIPEAIQSEWDRAAELGPRFCNMISKIRTELKELMDAEDPILAEVQKGIWADLNNAFSFFRTIEPYAVCTSCQGNSKKSCRLCSGRGFISENLYKNAVPEESKKMRASA